MLPTMLLVIVSAMIPGLGNAFHRPLHVSGAKIPQVIGFDPINGIVVIRESTTARTMQFRADPNLARTLKVGDWVEAEMETGRVTAVKGVAVSYPLVEPDRQTCCAIAAVAAATSPALGRLATARHKATGRTFQFLVDIPDLAKNLRVGQAVSMVPTTTAWALVTFGTTSYSFSVR